MNVSVRFIRGVIEFYRLCGLVVRLPGYTMEIYYASCEVRTEFIYIL
jgi:hypothetical protein